VLFADGNFRHCKPVLAAWFADCPEYSDLHHRERHVCFWCECPKDELGDYVPPDNQYPRQDPNLYRMLGDTNTMAADADLLSRHVHQGVRGCLLAAIMILDLGYKMHTYLR
jgi:hypothetical protein